MTSYTKKHKDQGLVVIAIHNSQGADYLDAFIAERGYTLPIAVDDRRKRTTLRHLELAPIRPPQPRLPAGLAQSGRRSTRPQPN